MSSKMASAVTKTTSACGTRPRRSVSTPMQKAMSVAMGMPHPGSARPARVEGGEDRGRHDHPPGCGDRGQERLAQRAELALDELTLDLHPDDEEEERHQAVVHEREQREADDRAGEPQRHRGSRTRRGSSPARRSPTRAPRRRTRAGAGRSPPRVGRTPATARPPPRRPAPGSRGRGRCPRAASARRSPRGRGGAGRHGPHGAARSTGRGPSERRVEIRSRFRSRAASESIRPAQR